MARMTHEQMVLERTSEAATCDYIQYPVRVSRRWRDGLLAAFPALESGKNALFYRRMVEYLLYSSFREEASGLLVMPAAVVAQMADQKVGENGFRAIEYLEDFVRDVWPITINDYVPLQEARTLVFDVPDAVIALQDGCRADDEQVWLVSGLPLSPTSRRKHADRYWESISYLADNIDSGHPAAELATWLNSQPRTTLGKLVRSNYHRVEALYEALPESTETECTWKRIIRHTLDLTWDQARLIYNAGEKTARITAKGLSIHLLPRALRKAALSGAIEMDIRSSQLAIVASLWNLTACSEFLASRPRQSFWSMMLAHLGLSADAKPALKHALYSACFGMGRAKMFNRLANGHGRITGIGQDASRAFLRHTLIAEVLAGRSRRMAAIKAAGGVEDAFGRWIAVSRERPLHSLLSVEAQSWELKLMLSVWQVVRDCSGAHLVSWLHDGVVVTHEDKRPGRVTGLIRACEHTFNSQAAALGFLTDLEVGRL